jgi:hypothetical protein
LIGKAFQEVAPNLRTRLNEKPPSKLIFWTAAREIRNRGRFPRSSLDTPICVAQPFRASSRCTSLASRSSLWGCPRATDVFASVDSRAHRAGSARRFPPASSSTSRPPRPRWSSIDLVPPRAAQGVMKIQGSRGPITENRERPAGTYLRHVAEGSDGPNAGAS